MNGDLVLVGGGKMGAALLEGWLARGLTPEQIHIVEPQAQTANALAARFKVRVAGDAAGLGRLSPKVIVFAVKPQMLAEVVGAYRALAEGGALTLSIAAGKPIAFFERAFGANAAVVRSMPNTPAAVRRGITVACANAKVGAEGRALAQDLLEAVGEVAWTEDESLMDAVTAVSGSGPAYVFLLAEAMAAAGVKVGLPKDLAERLARVTVSGAGELLRQSSEPAGVLRQNVTSPGGTTAAALAVLMADGGVQPLLDAAIAAATRRGKELAG